MGGNVTSFEGMILNYLLTFHIGKTFKKVWIGLSGTPLFTANCAVHHYYHTLLQVAITLFYLHMSISPFNLSKINLSLLWKDSDKKCAEKVLYLNENVRDQDDYLKFHDQTPDAGGGGYNI